LGSTQRFSLATPLIHHADSMVRLACCSCITLFHDAGDRMIDDCTLGRGAIRDGQGDARRSRRGQAFSGRVRGGPDVVKLDVERHPKSGKQMTDLSHKHLLSFDAQEQE
jgi:hypothetical protein